MTGFVCIENPPLDKALTINLISVFCVYTKLETVSMSLVISFPRAYFLTYKLSEFFLSPIS